MKHLIVMALLLTGFAAHSQEMNTKCARSLQQSLASSTKGKMGSGPYANRQCYVYVAQSDSSIKSLHVALSIKHGPLPKIFANFTSCQKIEGGVRYFDQNVTYASFGVASLDVLDDGKVTFYENTSVSDRVLNFAHTCYLAE